MIRTQRHSRFVLMSLDEIRATRDIVLQTEETKSNFSGSGIVDAGNGKVQPVHIAGF